MPFDFTPLKIPDVILIRPKLFRDTRGYFLESYKYSEYKDHGIYENFVQDNISRSSAQVIRGLHFQSPPFAQGKLVSVLEGEILDVAVDIRTRSADYGQWLSEKLSSENRHMLYIPPGFAHGFCVLSETAVVMYKCTAEYAAEHDRGILWSDPDIGIDWPVQNPIVSDKDRALPKLKEIAPVF